MPVTKTLRPRWRHFTAGRGERTRRCIPRSCGGSKTPRNTKLQTSNSREAPRSNEAPNSNFQAPEKHQASTSKSGTQIVNECQILSWGLEFGGSLELGAWSLEFQLPRLSFDTVAQPTFSDLVSASSRPMPLKRLLAFR